MKGITLVYSKAQRFTIMNISDYEFIARLRKWFDSDWSWVA